MVLLGLRFLQSSPNTCSLALYPLAFNGARSGESAGRANSPLCAEDPKECPMSSIGRGP